MSLYRPLKIETLRVAGIEESLRAMRNPRMSHARSTLDADIALASKLIRAGDEHAKAIRGCIVWAELDCQVGWMIELDTYRIGIETLSTSSAMYMDLAGQKGHGLAEVKQADLPTKIYRRTLMASYQALRRIHHQRRKHRHPDWQLFCNWIESLPYFDQLIMPEYSRAMD